MRFYEIFGDLFATKKSVPVRVRLAKPRLERLEDRLAPANITYIGPSGGDWGIAANWNPQQVPTATDEAIFNAQSNNCTAKPTFITTASAARLVNNGFTRVLTFQVPLTISGFVASTYAVSNWSGGQLIQVNVGTSVASITLNGGEFEWTGGTWNATPSTINDVYLSGGAQLDMYNDARIFGSNIWIGANNSYGRLKVGSNTGKALTGNVTMANGANITVSPQSPDGFGSQLWFAQGSTSSATVGGLATTNSQTITNSGTIIRNSGGNTPAVVCGLGIGNNGTLQLFNSDRLNVTGKYGGPAGNSIQQIASTAYTGLGVSSVLGVTFGYYQSGGRIQTASNPGFSASASISGNVTVVGGDLVVGDNNTTTSETLNITGDLTVGGSADVQLSVDGLNPQNYEQIIVSGKVTLNQGANDRAFLTILTINGSPQSGWSYGIITALGGFFGNNFTGVTNLGYPATWILPTIPIGSPYTITAQ